MKDVYITRINLFLSLFCNMSMQPIVLGISGKMGVGKNYISERYLLPQIMEDFRVKYGVQLLPYFFSFGSFIKSELYARDPTLTYNSLFHQKTNEIRTRLQEYGTAVGRDTIHKDVWIRHVDLWMQIQKENLDTLNHRTDASSTVMIPMFVIQDVRFENEAKFVESHPNGFVIRIEAPDRHAQRVVTEGCNGNHVSETALDTYSFSYRINNETNRSEDDICKDVDSVLQHIHESMKSV